jgi:hypothetical protein
MQFPAIEQPGWPGKAQVKRGDRHWQRIPELPNKPFHGNRENVL